MRRRYIAVKIKRENLDERSKTLSRGALWEAVWTNLIQLYGEYGASQADLSLIEYNPNKSYAIFRCSHKALDTVRTTISAVTKIGGLRLALHILYVSGTLKALKRRLMEDEKKL